MADSPNAWFSTQTAFLPELNALRAVALAAGLEETLKWRHPTYMDRGNNVLIIGVRKEHAVLSFLRGALLTDPKGTLLQPGQDRSARYLPVAKCDTLDVAYTQALIEEAIALTRAGRRVPKPAGAIDFVEELVEQLSADEAFAAAFLALTPGRQRGYNLYFAKAKKSETRTARIVRYTPRILAGKGLLDCVCGHSARPPGCDGSHNKHPDCRPY